jgi:TPR repeat protein
LLLGTRQSTDSFERGVYQNQLAEHFEICASALWRIVQTASMWALQNAPHVWLWRSPSMASILQDKQPATGQHLALPYLAAGLIGLACAGLLGRTWHTATPRPAMNLQQAIADFDTGHPAAATIAFRTLANAGDPHAAYWYGHALDRDSGTQADVKVAMVQYAKASAGGVARAGTRLGELYLDGNAVPPDFAKARSYLTEAAQRGDARAALDLGRMLHEGIGGPADPVAAYAWLEVASLRGNAQARQERDRLLPNLLPAQQVAAIQQVSKIMPAVTGTAVASPAHT